MKANRLQRFGNRLASVFRRSGSGEATASADISTQGNNPALQASADISTQGNNPALEVVCNGNQKFTFDIYKILSDSDGNLIFSPICIQIILALVYLGAKGTTAQEIAQGLHLPCDIAIIEKGFRALMDQLKGSGDTVLEIANKIYAQASFPIKHEFQASAAKFRAETEELDFVNHAKKSRTVINKWVEKKTNKIKDLIPSGSLHATTCLVLVNAIYLKALWRTPFARYRTSRKPFHITTTKEKTVDMMCIDDRFMYTEAQELDSQLVELPYKGGKLSMVIILPRKIDGLKELEEKLVDTNLSDILKKLCTTQVCLWLPKFRMNFQMDLRDTLQKLGMKTMFDVNADFSGINDSKSGLHVSKVFHKTFIEVNEEGTEAAASAGEIEVLLRGSPTPVYFEVNHPFVFFIKDTSSNILFFGHCLHP